MAAEIKRQANTQNLILAQTLAAGVEELLEFTRAELQTIAESTRLKTDRADLQRFLQSMVAEHVIIENVRIVNHEGFVYLSSLADDRMLDLSLTGHPSVQEPLNANKVFWSSPYLSDVDLKVAMTISIPFSDGIIIGYLRLSKLKTLISRILAQAAGTELVFITDAAGVLLAHPNDELVTQRANRNNLAIVQLGRHQATGSMVFSMDNREYLGSVARVSPTNWMVVSTQPVDIAYAMADRIRLVLYIGIIVSLLLALLISFISSKRLLKPLLELAAFTQKIARSDYSILPPESHKYDEIMALASCFTNMVHAIRERESSLQHSEAKFSGLLERLNEAVYRLSVPDGHCEYISPAARRIFGYPVETFNQHPFLLRELIHPDARSWFETQWEKIKAGNVPPSFEYRILDNEGRSRWIYQTNAAVMDDQGNIIAVESCCNEVTARRQAESELEIYRTHLEDLVRERTADLKAAQEELIKNEKLAVLGRLTATVSHELRNPLGVIRSSAYYLKRTMGKTDSKIEKHIDRIDEQVKACDIIVADLLEYTRGRTSNLAPDDLNEFLGDMLILIAIPEPIKLSLDLCRNLPSVNFDREKFRSVITNLMTNAIQAIKERLESQEPDHKTIVPGITITTEALNDEVVLMIMDNGAGMSAKTLERVFEPLFTTRARGTGLGLAIVHKIVSEHNGRIDIDSKPNNGTTVRIRLKNLTNELGQSDDNKTVGD